MGIFSACAARTRSLIITCLSLTALAALAVRRRLELLRSPAGHGRVAAGAVEAQRCRSCYPAIDGAASRDRCAASRGSREALELFSAAVYAGARRLTCRVASTGSGFTAHCLQAFATPSRRPSTSARVSSRKKRATGASRYIRTKLRAPHDSPKDA